MIPISEGFARAARITILTMSVAALVLVFQPVSQAGFALGCGVAFLAAILFNLMPFLQPGTPRKSLIRAAVILVIVVGVLVGLAVLSAWAYVLYLQSK